MDHTTLLASISTPTLVISSHRDLATPWQGRLEIVARGIPGAEIVDLPAAHLPNVEDPVGCNAALLVFFCQEAAETAKA
jgi:pimeloyl-ACP methyl ester carboxylesterase